MIHIDSHDGDAERSASQMWPTPEAVRTAPQYLSVAADTAQRIIAMMDATPPPCPLTRDDWETLVKVAEYDAQTAFLNRLANW